MLAPSKGSPRQKDYVVVGGQKVYLNFIHAKRQNHSNFPIPHSLANPFVKESSLVGAVRSAPASTTAAKRSPSGSRRRAEDDAAAAEPPPVILELRNQIIEHELGRRGDDDGADDCEFSIEEFTPPAAAAKKRKAAEAAAAASAIKRELEAVEMKRAAAEQDKRAERETRREIEKEKMARQKAKGKEKAPESSEEDENENDEGGNEGEEETDIPISKRRRTTVEPARRHPDKTPRTKSAPSPVASNNRTSPTSPRGLPSPAKSPFTVPTSPFAAASTRSDKRTTPAKSPRTSASSSAASASSALPSAAAATSNSTGPASSTSTSTSTSSTSACIPSSLDPMSSPSDEFEITSSFLATIDVLEKSVAGRWIEEKEDLDELSRRTDRGKTAEPKSEGAQSAARGTHERKPNGDGDDCDDSEGEEQLERKRARAALPAARGRTKATVGSGGVDREEVMDSQWIDSPFCMSTQAARAFAAAAPLASRAKRWANQSAAIDDGAGAPAWDESPASSWSPASPSSSPLQSGRHVWWPPGRDEVIRSGPPC